MNIFIFISSSLAVEDEDVTYPTIGKEKYPVAEKDTEALLPFKKKIGNFEYDLSASVIGGYDTNVKLEHYDPAASVFIQESLSAEGRYYLTDIFTLRGSYDLTSINYFRFSDQNLLNNVVGAGVDAKVTDFLTWSADYTADFVDYPHDKASEYTMNKVGTGLRHDITDRLYHKIAYSFSYKDYPKWRTRNDDGYRFLGNRKDTRNTIEHQLGFYPIDRTFIRTDNTIYFNNSNDPYLDYYDYMVLKTKATIVHLITDSLYGSVNGGYQYKSYRNRSLSDDGADDQRDHLIMGGASIFYDIMPNVSIGTSFDYRKNFSNEGEQKYTDYIVSSGVYARF
jgi:hypothetical protein